VFVIEIELLGQTFLSATTLMTATKIMTGSWIAA